MSFPPGSKCNAWSGYCVPVLPLCVHPLQVHVANSGWPVVAAGCPKREISGSVSEVLRKEAFMLDKGALDKSRRVSKCVITFKECLGECS